MNKLFDIKRFRFYLWLGLAYFTIGVLFSLHDPITSFGKHVLNELWHAIYITFVNYWFFEYVLPRLSTRRLLRSAFLIILLIILYSWISYAWRMLGIDLHIYTSLATF